MLEIPEAAMPVVEVLRRDVPRPTVAAFMFPSERFGLDACPMGLHERSTRACPIWAQEFAGGECSDRAVRCFALWWDTVPTGKQQQAMDLIWPQADKE